MNSRKDIQNKTNRRTKGVHDARKGKADKIHADDDALGKAQLAVASCFESGPKPNDNGHGWDHACIARQLKGGGGQCVSLYGFLGDGSDMGASFRLTRAFFRPTLSSQKAHVTTAAVVTMPHTTVRTRERKALSPII